MRGRQMVCQSCGRKLKETVSVERGYGPVCWERLCGGTRRRRRSSRAESKKVKSPEVEENINIPGQMSIEDYPEFMS